MKRELKPRIPRKRRTAPIFAGVLTAAAALVVLIAPPWVFPPIASIETGPRAIEMVQFRAESRGPGYRVPEAQPPAEPYEGEQTAGELYENVQILGDLTDGEFTRLMLSITEWVSPDQGCEYCHNLDEGFASDDVYTKVVARSMLEMVRNINTNWPEHVAPAGVTCYTCHRGQNIPSESWFDQNDPGPDQFLGKSRPWYLEAKTIRQFFPSIPYAQYLDDDPLTARLQSLDPLPSSNPAGNGDGPLAVAESPNVDRDMIAENLYLFMMQQSNALGVNCTYCHNSRAFFDWSQSTPFRWIAYWGIRMVRDINVNYIRPVTDVFPPERLGPLGDPAKVNCGTCHRGETKPLGGNALMHAYAAGLSENGEVPDPAPKEAVLIGEAIPVAQTGTVDDESPTIPVSEQTDGEAAQDSETAAPPGDMPTGADAPVGASPQRLDPGTPMQESDPQSAPSAGDPGTGTGEPVPSETETGTDADQPPETEDGADGAVQPAPDASSAESGSGNEAEAAGGAPADTGGDPSDGDPSSGTGAEAPPSSPGVRIIPQSSN